MKNYRGYVIKPHAIRKREIEALKARVGDDWVDHVGDPPPNGTLNGRRMLNRF